MDSPVFSILNCLAGGVVLSVALCHMLPEAHEQIEGYLQDQKESIREYPFAFLGAGVSLIFLVCLEQAIMGSGDNHFHQQHDHPRYDETGPLHDSSVSRTSSMIFEQDAAGKIARSGATVFLIALSTHSLLEGLGLGASIDSSGFVTALIAVVSHKMLAALALGLSVHGAHFPRLLTVVLIAAFSIATPFGIAIGILAGELNHVGELVSGVLSSLSAGSFLFIALVELIPEELSKPEKKGLKLTAITVGFGLMSLMAMYA